MGRRKRKPTEFKKILVSLMEEKQLGVRETARLAGTSPSTITDWRSGTNPNDFLAVKKLANALGVSLSFLLTGEDETRPKGSSPSVTEVFDTGGILFDGYARIKIERLIQKSEKEK